MAHDGVGPGGDELVVVAEGELEGEEAAEVAVAGDADGGTQQEEEEAEEEGARDAYLCGGAGCTAQEEREDGARERVGAVVLGEEDGDFAEVD
ncbi:hypothetical protein A0H81_03453 [Grifola frondosa]|uniref:Uncharacterized protein n=1 Tax=Grifola frondosa TaxID=5627 RepID=A0A1C7MHG6_GRIFR|nr:hypothetical protein A0H81_03453 [Grifola frondosa]